MGVDVVGGLLSVDDKAVRNYRTWRLKSWRVVDQACHLVGFFAGVLQAKRYLVKAIILAVDIQLCVTSGRGRYDICCHMRPGFQQPDRALALPQRSTQASFGRLR